MMDANERIYIPPKRGRLPRKYENLDRPSRGDRWILVMLGICIAFWVACYVLWRIYR